MEIEFDYIDSSEGIKLQVLHTGSENEFNIECKINSGKAIRNYRKLKKHKGFKGFSIALLQELASMFFLIIDFILSDFIFQIVSYIAQEYIVTLILFALIVAVALMLIYLKIVRKLRKRFIKLFLKI